MFFDVDTSRWPQGNYENPPVAGTYLLPVEYCLLAVSTIVLSLRLVSRGCFLKCLGLDDYCAIASWVFATILIVSNMVMVTCGYGRHIYDVSPDSRMYVLFHAWLYQWAAAASTGFSKLSICFFFLRFIPGRTSRILVHLTIVYVALWSVTMTGVWFFRCHRFSDWWTEQVHAPGTCMSAPWFIRFTGLQAFFGASSHFIMLFLPLTTLWKLDISRWRKFWLAFVLWMGGICCFFASGRIYYTVLGVQNQDITWYGYKALLFQALEIESQVIYTCMPFLGPAAQAIYNPILMGLQKLSGSGIADENPSLEFVSIDAARVFQTAGNFALSPFPRTPTSLTLVIPTPPNSPASIDVAEQPQSNMVAFPPSAYVVESPYAGNDHGAQEVDVEAQDAVSVRLTHISGGSLRRITVG